MNAKHVVLGVLMLSAVPALAGTDELQLNARIGTGSLRVKPNVLADRLPDDVDVTTFGIGLGYVTPIGILVEGNYASSANRDSDSDWFGDNDELHYRLSEYTLAIGYQLETPRGFRVIPKVGRSRWDLYSRDMPFLYGDVDDYHHLRGYQNFWELGLQKTLGKAVALGVTYKDNDFDFGSSRSLALTINVSM